MLHRIHITAFHLYSQSLDFEIGLVGLVGLMFRVIISGRSDISSDYARQILRLFRTLFFMQAMHVIDSKESHTWLM